MFFVFIGGASASGKTGVSEHLLKKLTEAGIKAQKLNMDDYYRERPDAVSIEEFRANTNFDLPTMLHLDLFQNHVAALSKGDKIKKPIFSFLTNKRSGEEDINPSDVIIVEGIFAQYFYQKYMPADFPALNVNVSTDSHYDIVERRIARDMATRGRSRDEVIAQEHRYVGPGFFQFTASHATGSDLYIHNKKYKTVEEQGTELDRVADEIIGALHKRKEEISTAITPFVRTKKPDVREIVARSHFKAGNCTDSKFTGYFSGVFGGVKGTYEEVFAPEPASSISLSN